MDTFVTVVGNLTDDPELRFTPNGHAVANFRLAVTSRVREGDAWKDGDTSFFRVNVWRQQAENVAESVAKGNRVIVNGRLKSRAWETPEGDKRSIVEIDADEVGPSLKWATARPERDQQRRHQERAVQRRAALLTATAQTPAARRGLGVSSCGRPARHWPPTDRLTGSPCPGRPGTASPVGAAAGPLHPAADRPFSRPAGGSHGASAPPQGARVLRTGRPAALDPAPDAVGRGHAVPRAGGSAPPGREREGPPCSSTTSSSGSTSTGGR